MDDILVYSPTLETHLQHLEVVSETLQHSRLFAKLSKCIFATNQLEYLGHIIPDRGVSTDPDKTEAMKMWPVTTSATELRGFLGLTRYYRKFVKELWGVSQAPYSATAER